MDSNENLNMIYEKMIEEYKLVQNQCVQIQELNIKNNEQIENYKIMMENIILEYHKLCTKLFN